MKRSEVPRSWLVLLQEPEPVDEDDSDYPGEDIYEVDTEEEA